MPEQPPREFRSFSDAHHEWEKHHREPGWRKFLRSSILIPSPKKSRLNTVLGYCWRMIFLAVISAVVFELLVRSYLRTESFADLVAAEAGNLFKCEETFCAPLRWKDRSAAIGFLDVKGSAESFFHGLRAEGIRFSVPGLMLFKDQWTLDRVSVLAFDIDLHLDTSSAQDVLASTRKDRQDKKDKEPEGRYGIHPDFKLLKFEDIQTSEGTFRWGSNRYSRGSLENAAMDIIRSDFGYTFKIASGSLSQNWLKNLKIESLEVHYAPGIITIENGEVTLGPRGKGSVTGTIRPGAASPFELKVELTSVQLDDLLAAEHRDFVDGLVDVSLKLTGSADHPDGVSCTGSLKFTDGVLKNIRALETLTSIYADQRFRRPKITGGTVHFSTSIGRLEVSEFDLSCGDFLQLGGKLSYGSDSGQIDGTLVLGVNPEALAKIPEIAAHRFPNEQGGYLWNTSSLGGTIGTITGELAQQLAGDHRKIMLMKKQ